jgi:hypothetical protein
VFFRLTINCFSHIEIIILVHICINLINIIYESYNIIQHRGHRFQNFYKKNVNFSNLLSTERVKKKRDPMKSLSKWTSDALLIRQPSLAPHSKPVSASEREDQVLQETLVPFGF